VLDVSDPRFRLHDLLTRYEAAVPTEPPASPGQAREEAIVEAFDQLVREVIRPAMEAIGAELGWRGHEYEIAIVPGQQITMHIYLAILPQPAYAAPWCPYVAFSRDASSAKVHVLESTILPNGRGRVEITDTLRTDQITRSLVESRILNVLEGVLDSAGSRHSGATSQTP
jgi:hypothetical protein